MDDIRECLKGPAFEFEARVRYSEVDHRGRLTLPALVNYFQDCSTFQSEVLGVGMAWLKSEQKAWVLSHWQIVVDRYPELCEEIAVGTFAYKFRGLMANRNFYMKDGAGRIIARADSSWVFMDLAKGKPPSTWSATAWARRLRCRPKRTGCLCRKAPRSTSPSRCSAA